MMAALIVKIIVGIFLLALVLAVAISVLNKRKSRIEELGYMSGRKPPRRFLSRARFASQKRLKRVRKKSSTKNPPSPHHPISTDTHKSAHLT